MLIPISFSLSPLLSLLPVHIRIRPVYDRLLTITYGFCIYCSFLDALPLISPPSPELVSSPLELAAHDRTRKRRPFDAFPFFLWCSLAVHVQPTTHSSPSSPSPSSHLNPRSFAYL
ncbi:hypothetical protein BDM02DRAFT_2367784 [Thelephora ganbajun]|uniref:Uncharacterized protein n=1 Tax=Thelephora ganbajun TaxID=370292 RepID=A0ACB6ZT85_THEGA|nr:hypothetical protein BDM02DRAFT_2367784 [Thelephora ganbajun]